MGLDRSNVELVLSSRTDLGILYLKQDRYELAERNLVQAIDIGIAHCNSESHSQLLRAVGALEVLYGLQSRFPELLDPMKRIHEHVSSHHADRGPRPDGIELGVRLAGIMIPSGRETEGLLLLRESLEAFREHPDFGPSHKRTTEVGILLSVFQNLVDGSGGGASPEAIRRRRRALLSDPRFGLAHSEVDKASVRYWQALVRQGLLAEVRADVLSTTELRESTLQMEHDRGWNPLPQTAEQVSGLSKLFDPAFSTLRAIGALDDDVVERAAFRWIQWRLLDETLTRALESQALRAFRNSRGGKDDIRDALDALEPLEAELGRERPRTASDLETSEARIEELHDRFCNDLPDTWSRALAPGSEWIQDLYHCYSALVSSLVSEHKVYFEWMRPHAISFDDSIDSDRPALWRGHRSGGVTGLLSSNEAVVLYFSSDAADVYAAIATRDDLRVVPIRASSAPEAPWLSRIELLDTIRLYRLALDANRASRSEQAFPFEIGHQLYQWLWEPLEETGLLVGIDHVFLVKDPVLSRVPFSALVTRSYRPADPSWPMTGREPWLFREYAFSTLPGLKALQIQRTQERVVGEGVSPLDSSLLVVGDPELDPGQGLAFLGPQQPLQSVSKLPSIQGLAPFFERLVGFFERKEYLAREMRRDGATEEAFRRADLTPYRWIVFLTHALVAGELEAKHEPAIVLTPSEAATSPDQDGALFASEVLELELDADFVVLGACNTSAGAADSIEAPALAGLAKAFFAAGADSLLVTHWSVLPQSTTEMIESITEQLLDDPAKGRAFALRDWMAGNLEKVMPEPERSLLDDLLEWAGLQPATEPFDHRHPAYWAPYVIVGDGQLGLRPTAARSAE